MKMMTLTTTTATTCTQGNNTIENYAEGSDHQNAVDEWLFFLTNTTTQTHRLEQISEYNTKHQI